MRNRMCDRATCKTSRGEKGIGLIELLIAMVVLSIGYGGPGRD